jgi:ABC-type transporter Mla MlaB component
MSTSDQSDQSDQSNQGELSTQALIDAISLPESITMATCSEVAISLRKQIAAIAGSGPVALDATSLKHFDSSFWSLYATLRRDTGRLVMLNNLPSKLQSLGTVYGLWGHGKGAQ